MEGQINLSHIESLEALPTAIEEQSQKLLNKVSVTVGLGQLRQLVKLAKIGIDTLAKRRAREDAAGKAAATPETKDKARALLLDGNLPEVVCSTLGLSRGVVNGIRTQLIRAGKLKSGGGVLDSQPPEETHEHPPHGHRSKTGSRRSWA